MSMVGVYRSVPSPQPDLYRYSRAPDAMVLRSPGGQGVEQSKTNISSGTSSSLSPSITDNSQPGPCAQDEASSSSTPPKPAAAQSVTQLPKIENIDPSLKPITDSEVENGKDRLVQPNGENQVSQTCNGGDSTMSVGAPSSNGPEKRKEHDEELAGDLSNSEDIDGGQAKPGGDDKKKSKRFRLTHNQTRFLMSEFTRQAHPDASHRERLSREIPGLSPRQVQVWFQNRRAKLKRLTSQDRDRVLKSRALPENFDRTQMLHQPYNSRQSANTSPTSPTISRPSFPSGGLKPLAVSNITRNPGEDYPVSPASAASAYGSYVNSPGLPEPFSSASNNPGNAVTASFSAPGPTHFLPRVPGIQHDYSRSHSFSSSYAPGWQPYPPQRLPLPSSDSSIKPENMTSIHRPSASYPGLAGSIPELPYERHSSQANPAGHGTATPSNTSLPGLAYQGAQTQPGQAEQYPASTQDSHDAYTPGNYRHVLTLQTAQLPPPHEYQMSPFTPSYSSSYSFDSFYQYAHENTSAVSLPASYMRSHTDYESPSGYSYDNSDMNRIAAPNPGKQAGANEIEDVPNQVMPVAKYIFGPDLTHQLHIQAQYHSSSHILTSWKIELLLLLHLAQSATTSRYTTFSHTYIPTHSNTMTQTRPSTCCGRSENGCICAAQAKCECGRTSAEKCDCSKKAVHDPHSGGARCSCRMRPAGQCTCERAVSENKPVEGDSCPCGQRPVGSCTCEKAEKVDAAAAATYANLETNFTSKA